MGETKENNIQQTSEQDLWQEEAAMMHIFSRNRKNNLRTLLSLFKGHYGALVPFSFSLSSIPQPGFFQSSQLILSMQ